MSHICDKKWICRMVLILMVVLFALPLSVSAEQLDISGQTELTVLKGKSYQLVFTEAASLLQKLNTAAQTESTATGAQTETEQKDNVITWSSSKKSVVSVSATGKIRAKKTGSAMITAQLGELKYYVKVTVNTPVTKVKLNKTSKTIKCGKTYTLKATVKPSKNVNKKVTWSSSNTKVAKVNSKGKVTAIGIGTCKITATAADGSGKKATCKIKVKAGTMTMSKETMTLSLGSSEMLQVQNVDTTDITWGSSDSNVAAVSSDGVVSAVETGTAVIAARKKDGSKSVYCNVTVVETSVATGASARALQLLSVLQKYSDQVKSDYTSGTPWTYANSGASSTWASAVAKKHKVNCALMVRWALRELDIIDSSNFWGVSGGGIEFRGNVKDQLLRYCDIIKVYKTPNQLLAEGNLLPGDICTWKEIQHTNVYAGNGLWYDAGRGVNITSSGTFTSFGPSAAMSMTNKTVGYIIRLK